jgi:hypothetical protein
MSNICMYVCMYVCMCVCIYIYIEREREREWGEHFSVLLSDIFFVVAGLKYSWGLESLISFFQNPF